MKILPVINNLQKQVVDKSNTFTKAGREGYSIGMRTSRMHKQNKLLTTVSVSKGVPRKVLKKASAKDLPYVAGAVGLLLPIPLASLALLVIGKVIQKGISLVRK